MDQEQQLRSGGDPIVPEPPPPRRSRRSDLGGLFPALLLAVLGLAGALVAWRVAVAGNVAGDEDRAALNAARARSSAVLAAEQQVSQATGAWLDYERAEKRAAALDAAGFHDEALQEKEVATAHWSLVRPEFISSDGVYHSDQHRAALIEGAATTQDIDPAPHEQAADREYRRVGSLLSAALVIALALPLATFAEVTRGRWRAVTGIAGAAVLLIGAALLATVW